MASVVNENTSHLNVTSEEISEITNIINGLMIMMDIGDSKEFSNFFLDDPNSTLTIEIAKKDSRGREEIAKACDGIYNKFCIGDEPCKHWEGNIYLKKIQMHDINKTVILNRSYWKSIKGGEVMSTGLHTDVFQQDDKDGRWYIFHRIIQHTWTKNSGFINLNKKT